MKKIGLLLTLTSMMLLCSCGGTKYTNTLKHDSGGVSLEAKETLTLYEDTFKLETMTLSSYTESAAENIGVSGEVEVKTVDVITGTYTASELLADTYTLKSEEVKSYVKISGKGKEDYKELFISLAAISGYTEEEAKKLADGKTVTKEVSSTIVVKVNSEEMTFGALGN